LKFKTVSHGRANAPLAAAAVVIEVAHIPAGDSAFRFRDPGFLGIMEIEDDAVYLNLKKGKNV
jgi:hypothetical protein